MIILILIIVLGLVIGSFLNVVIYRVPRGESIIWPGSHCTHCGEKIKAQDLIPVFSYLLLKGRCRYCNSKISRQYLLVELITAAAFLVIYSVLGWSIASLAAVILTMLLIPAAFIDLNLGIIPNRITITGIILGLLISPFTVGLASSLMGSLFFMGILYLAAFITTGGMGGGDIKLAAAIGAFTGWQGAVLAFMLASISGGMVGLFLLLSCRANRKTAIKFGPYLALGGFIAYVWGTQIIEFYLLWI